MKRRRLSISLLLSFGILLVVAGCSSSPPVKTQAFAKLNNQRVYEYEFPVVWKGIEETVRRYQITKRSPSEVDPLEMRKLTRRTLETDWIYGESRDKYQEYQVNGSPRKIYLQSRFKYAVEAQRVMGGVSVTVKTDEEIERLNSDGTPAGYKSIGTPDPSRQNELLDKINIAILSLPNTN